MLATSEQRVPEEPMAGPPSAAVRPAAPVSVRVTAYLVDSALLLGFLLIFFVIGGAVLLFTSDLGKEDPPDSAFSAFIAVFIGGPVLFWSLFNIAMMRWRAQSAGMYIIGIRAESADGGSLSPGRLLLRWFGMHPLLFHPLMIPIWLLLSAYATSATLSRSVLVVTLALALLCIVAPLAGLIAMVTDSSRRGVHDRLAQTIVIRLGR